MTDEEYRDLVARLNPSADVTLVEGEVRIDYPDGGEGMRVRLGSKMRAAAIEGDRVVPVEPEA